jgi:integrase
VAQWKSDTSELLFRSRQARGTVRRELPGPWGQTADKLTARDIRQWLNQLRQQCQCCAQAKDARRPEVTKRCCASGQVISARTVKDVRDTLRAALGHAVSEDELIVRNPAALVRLPAARTRKVRAWSVAEACQFLNSARAERDPLYTAYVLMLVLGLRLGEALGLPWECVNLDAAELDVKWQLLRAGGQLRHRETKTPGSDAPLPLPGICLAAIKLQAEQQTTWRADAGPVWHDSGLVITTRYGTPYEPRNFLRHFVLRCSAAGLRYIKPHGMRRTRASPLAALDVRPGSPCEPCDTTRSPRPWRPTPTRSTTAHATLCAASVISLAARLPLLHFAAALRARRPVTRW